MLHIHQLTKRFGDRTVLDGVDLAIQPGEIVALLGPNGAGKTTLVSTVAGLRDRDGGCITIDDQPFDHPVSRGRLGIAPQQLGLYPTMTTGANLAFAGRLAGLRGRKLDAGIDRVSNALDLTPLLDHRAGELSGGQQRRLHTAMALVHQPDVVFLDEPTVGADVESRDGILAHVRALAKAGSAVCYTTHYLPEVEALAADPAVTVRVAVLHQGRIQICAPLDEFVARYGQPALQITFDEAAPPLDGFAVDGRIATGCAPEPGRLLATAFADANRDGWAEQVVAIDLTPASLDNAYRNLMESA